MALAVMLCASSGPCQATPELAAQDIVVKMEPIKKRTRALTSFFVRASKYLIRKGVVRVGDEDFTIYLPREKGNDYSVAPRPKRKGLLNWFTSTHLSVDQNHDGKIETWENYYAEFPLRIGDSMFDVVAFGDEGSSMTLRPSGGPLRGAVIGRVAPDFALTTVTGKVLRRDDFKGKAVAIDVWAPS